MKIKLLLIFVLAQSLSCAASLNLEISNPDVAKLSISIMNINNAEQNFPVAHVIEHDLQTSGAFNIKYYKYSMLNQNQIPQFDFLRKLGIDLFVVIESQIPDNSETGNVKINFLLWDVIQEKQLIASNVITASKDWRYIAHTISNMIYESSTGLEGYFGARIAYVEENGNRQNFVKRIVMVDHDSYNKSYLTSGDYSASLPCFINNGSHIIFLSHALDSSEYEFRSVNLATGEEKIIANNIIGKILSSRGAPQSQKILISIFDEDKANIYILDAEKEKKRQITFDKEIINDFPSFSPDETKIVFSSDRGGKRQLYVMDNNGANIKLISSGNSIYSAPYWSPNGEFIAFNKVSNGMSYLGIMKPDGSEERIVAQDFFTESFAWSPNSRHIVFTNPRTKHGMKRDLYSIDIKNGKTRVINTSYSVSSSPDWSPSLLELEFFSDKDE